MPRAFFFTICWGVAFSCQAQCLKIYGLIKDYNNGTPISKALIISKIDNKRHILFATQMNGQFQIVLPCNVSSLLIEAKGYRPLNFRINSPQEPLKDSFFVPIALTPIDFQSLNKPFSQTGQKKYTLNNTHSTSKNTHYTTYNFEVVDAQSGKYIESELCLFFTKTNTKDCRSLSDGRSGGDVTFKYTDIIALEATAKGYESYYGNLILENLNGNKSTYQIQLSRSLRLLTVSIKATEQPINCQLASDKIIPLVTANGEHFWTYLPPDSNYILQIVGQNGQNLYSKPVTFLEGINFYSLDISSTTLPSQTSKAAAAKIPIDSFGVNAQILYFDKSEYKLRLETQFTLDTLAIWLHSHPDDKIQITGHTDNVGLPNLNQTLSEFRAKVTYNYLLIKGAKAHQMQFGGMGSREPSTPNDTEQNRQKNRRVEIRLLSNPSHKDISGH